MKSLGARIRTISTISGEGLGARGRRRIGHSFSIETVMAGERSPHKSAHAVGKGSPGGAPRVDPTFELVIRALDLGIGHHPADRDSSRRWRDSGPDTARSATADQRPGLDAVIAAAACRGDMSVVSTRIDASSRHVASRACSIWTNS